MTKSTTGDCRRTSTIFDSPDSQCKLISTEQLFLKDEQISVADGNLSYGAISNLQMQLVDSTPNGGFEAIDSNRKSKNIFSVNFLIVPFFFLHVTGIFFHHVIQKNIFMEKGCLLVLNYSVEICSNLSAHQSNLNSVQKVANDYTFYRTIITVGPSTIISIFVGGWNNQRLRKFRVLIALFGIIISDIGFILNTIHMDWPIYCLLITSVPEGLFGGVPVVTVYVYMFICEKFSLEDRTLLCAALKAAMTIGGLAGMFFSGQLFEYSGYTAVLSCAIVSQSVCFLYILIAVKIHTSPDEQKYKVPVLLKKMCNYSNFVENLGAYMKKRENYDRLEIWLLTVALGIAMILKSVPSDVLLLFCIKMFNWSFTTFTNMNTISMIVVTAVTVTVTPICTKFLRVKDPVLGILGSTSIFGQYLCYGLSNKEGIFYIGMGIGMFADFSMFAILSSLSKIVAVDEVGQIFAVAASFENLSSLLESLFGTRIYNATVDIYPGSALIFMAILMLFPLGLFSWKLNRERKKDVDAEKPLLANNNCPPRTSGNTLLN